MIKLTSRIWVYLPVFLKGHTAKEYYANYGNIGDDDGCKSNIDSDPVAFQACLLSYSQVR